MPKQIPRNGIFFCLACLIAAIFPSVPLLPNPPGIKIPETSFRIFLISDIFKRSESILIKFTFKLFLIKLNKLESRIRIPIKIIKQNYNK